MRQVFILSSLITLSQLLGCIEEKAPEPIHKIEIHATQLSSSYFFAGIPITFKPIDYISYTAPVVQQWTFGDGATSSKYEPKHVYLLPGRYQVKVTLDGGKHSIDSMFTILPKQKIIGSVQHGELGKFIFKVDENSYGIVHINTSDAFLHLTKVSSNFDSITSKTIAVRYSETDQFFLNKQGNLVIVGGTLHELSKNGDLLKSERTGLYAPAKFLETETAYLLSQQWSDYIHVHSLFKSGAPREEINILTSREGHTFMGYDLESENIVRLYYTDPSVAPDAAGNGKNLIVKKDFSGATLYEKEYNIFLPFDNVISLSSGELLFSGLKSTSNEPGETYHAFNIVKMNSKGDLQWRNQSRSLQSFSEKDWSIVNAFDENGFTYLFLGSQVGSKINSKGDIVWNSRFGSSLDYFQCVIRNEAGNFVAVSSHDRTMNDEISNLGNNDILVQEIDLNGNIVIR